MKRLYLLRHAKSGWDDPSLTDHDRPLAPRGIAAAELLASVMIAEAWRPDTIFCSTATRTRQTLDLIRPSLAPDTMIAFDRDLYAQMSRDYFAIIAAADNATSSLMLIGHNTATESTAQSLVNDGTRHLAGYPTAGLAIIDLDIEHWSKTAPRRGTLAAFWVPRHERVV